MLKSSLPYPNEIQHLESIFVVSSVTHSLSLLFVCWMIVFVVDKPYSIIPNDFFSGPVFHLVVFVCISFDEIGCCCFLHISHHYHSTHPSLLGCCCFFCWSKTTKYSSQNIIHIDDDDDGTHTQNQWWLFFIWTFFWGKKNRFIHCLINMFSIHHHHHHLSLVVVVVVVSFYLVRLADFHWENIVCWKVFLRWSNDDDDDDDLILLSNLIICSDYNYLFFIYWIIRVLIC